MTVEELIEKLEEIEDKTMDVMIVVKDNDDIAYRIDGVDEDAINTDCDIISHPHVVDEDSKQFGVPVIVIKGR